jgi:hypothetical protein
MKLALLASLIASAAAFAPSSSTGGEFETWNIFCSNDWLIVIAYLVLSY